MNDVTCNTSLERTQTDEVPSSNCSGRGAQLEKHFRTHT